MVLPFCACFLVLLGLCCCAGFLCLQTWGLLPGCGGHLSVVLLLPWSMGSRVHGLQQLPCSMWDLSGPGTTPGSPAQAGGVLTTRAPGKPSPWLLFLNIIFMRKNKSRTEHPELWKRWEMGKQWKQCQTLFFGAPKSLQMVTAAMKVKDAYSLEGKL